MALVDDLHGRHWGSQPQGAPLFGPSGRPQRGPAYAAIRNGPEFGDLRRKHRWFVFPVSLLFMVWYMVFVLLAAYAHNFMAIPVLGLINVGMILGMAQFASTLVIMVIYCRYAERTLDPAVERVRRRAGVR